MSNCEEQLTLFPKPDDERKRKSPDGVTPSNLIFTAHVGTNEELFPQILDLQLTCRKPARPSIHRINDNISSQHLIRITWPLQDPFRSEPFSILDSIVEERQKQQQGDPS